MHFPILHSPFEAHPKTTPTDGGPPTALPLRFTIYPLATSLLLTKAPNLLHHIKPNH